MHCGEKVLVAFSRSCFWDRLQMIQKVLSKYFPAPGVSCFPQGTASLLRGNPIDRAQTWDEELCYFFMLLFLSPAPDTDVQSDSSTEAKSSLFLTGSVFSGKTPYGWLTLFYRDFSSPKRGKEILSVCQIHVCALQWYGSQSPVS